MDLTRPNVLDNRRLEIVADGLPLFMDTTIVSVLKRWFRTDKVCYR